MMSWLAKLLGGLLLVIGLGTLYLTNRGALSFRRPYVFQFSEQLPAAGGVVAFEGVNLVPMDRERILEDQTVLVRDGVIAQVGQAGQVPIPQGAVIIDGGGKYLMPGLVDMHVHIEFENDMLMLVANGVTSVRNMWGNSGKKLRVGLADQAALRRQIEQGILLGPTIYTAGPVMEGQPAFHPLADAVTSPGQAAQSVAWQQAQGYDFIKVYDHLSPQVYAAVIEAARQQDLPVAGHVPFAVGLEGVLASGQRTIEHLTGYIDPDAAQFLIPEDQLDDYAARTRQAGVWNCVTLSVYPVSKQDAAGFEQLQNQLGMRYVSPGWRMLSPFFYLMAARSHTYPGADYPERIAALNRQMVAALQRAGAGILLGTDAAQPYHLPGFAVHDELAMLVEAGLSPYQALQAGTRSAALVLGRLEEFGTIQAGRRADLLLLEENPLADVGNVQMRAGVMLRGRWLPEAELQAMLDGLEASFQPTPADRLWPLLLVAAAAFPLRRRPA